MSLIQGEPQGQGPAQPASYARDAVQIFWSRREHHCTPTDRLDKCMGGCAKLWNSAVAAICAVVLSRKVGEKKVTAFGWAKINKSRVVTPPTAMLVSVSACPSFEIEPALVAVGRMGVRQKGICTAALGEVCKFREKCRKIEVCLQAPNNALAHPQHSFQLR